jgi:hypothetical protein
MRNIRCHPRSFPSITFFFIFASVFLPVICDAPTRPYHCLGAGSAVRSPHGYAVDDVPVLVDSQWQALCLLPRPALLSPRITILAALQPLVHVEVKMIDIVAGAGWW